MNHKEVLVSIIETRGLTRRYGKAHGIQNVSLRVEEGEIFGEVPDQDCGGKNKEN